jgi:hypothetical protein
VEYATFEALAWSPKNDDVDWLRIAIAIYEFAEAWIYPGSLRVV